MATFLMILGVVIFAAAAAMVLHEHWQEMHGGNRY